MGLWSRVAGLFGRRRKMSPEEWWEEFFGGSSRSATGEVVTQLSALRVAAVWACATILAEDVAKLPWHVYRQQPDGGKSIAGDHPLERLLQRPNGYQNGFEFKEQMMAALVLRRNAYAPIIRDGRGAPVALIPVNPDWTTLYQAPDGQIFYNVARQNQHLAAMLKSLPLMIPAEDMLHIRGMSLNSLWGQSAISSGKDAIGLALAQQSLAAVFASNGAQLSGVLEAPNRLSDIAYERLKQSWKEKRSGISNAGETAILEEGMKFSKLGMTSVDAEFIAARNFQVAEMARMFRIPLHKLGVSDRSTNATMAQAEQEYSNNTVLSWVTRIEQKLNETFGLLDQGLFVELDMSHFLRADITSRFNAYRAGIVGMFMEPNRARRAEGWGDMEGGDKLYQPTNVAPLGFEPAGRETGPGSDFTNAAAPGGDGDPAASPDPQDSAPTG